MKADSAVRVFTVVWVVVLTTMLPLSSRAQRCCYRGPVPEDLPSPLIAPEPPPPTEGTVSPAAAAKQESEALPKKGSGVDLLDSSGKPRRWLNKSQTDYAFSDPYWAWDEDTAIPVDVEKRRDALRFMKPRWGSFQVWIGVAALSHAFTALGGYAAQERALYAPVVGPLISIIEHGAQGDKEWVSYTLLSVDLAVQVTSHALAVASLRKRNPIPFCDRGLTLAPVVTPGYSGLALRGEF